MPSKSFDWKSLQKFLNPEAAGDFSRFMDTLPIHVGRGSLIAAGIAWAAVATIGFFAVLQAKELTEIRAEFQTSEAIKPMVPTITLDPVSNDEITKLVDRFKDIYPTLTMSSNGGTVAIQSKQTSDFAQFREAIGHVINGGKGWKIEVESLCVGRECKDTGLSARLKIQKLKIDMPSS